MKKLIFIAVLMLIAIVPAFGQKITERVYIYAEDDSLVINYSFDPGMAFLAVQEDGTMIGPKEIDYIQTGVLYWNKQWTYVFLNSQGAWSKIPMPKPGVYDFTWDFTTKTNHRAFSLVDKFSQYATTGTTRDKNLHFEVEITGDKKVVPRGSIRK